MTYRRFLMWLITGVSLAVLLVRPLGYSNATPSLSSSVQYQENSYEIIVDGIGVDSLKPLPLNRSADFYSTNYRDGYILVGRGEGQHLFISVVPRLGWLHSIPSGSITKPTFVKIIIQFHNASLIGVKNSLKHFNWPFPDRQDCYPRQNERLEIFDWLEVDWEHLSNYSDERGMNNFHPDFARFGRDEVPDWWREAATPPPGWSDPNNPDPDNNPTPWNYYTYHPVFDVFEVINSTDIFLRTTACEGTDSLLLSYNITQHPASISIFPLMDHKAYNCEENVYVGPRGRAYGFEEAIPLTRIPQRDEENPPVTPVDGNPPILPTPNQGMQAGSALSLSTAISATGAITAVGVTSGVLVVILSIHNRPQVAGRKCRQRRRKDADSRKKSVLLKRARQMSGDLSRSLISHRSDQLQLPDGLQLMEDEK